MIIIIIFIVKATRIPPRPIGGSVFASERHWEGYGADLGGIGVWGGSGETLGRLWGGSGEVLGKLWGGSGEALGASWAAS